MIAHLINSRQQKKRHCRASVLKAKVSHALSQVRTKFEYLFMSPKIEGRALSCTSRKAVDAQRANCRAAEAQKKQLADMLRKDEMEIQELRNELADKKEELNAANRKLHTLKCNDTLISQPSLPIPVGRSRYQKALKSWHLPSR